MKVFRVTDPVFKTEPLFIADCSYVELRGYLKKRFRISLDGKDDPTTVGHMLTFDRSPWRVVWVRRWSDLPALMHEIFHLVTRICADKGIAINSKIDEPAAYLFEFFARACFRRQKRLRAG